MRLKSGIILSKEENFYVLVTTGEASLAFSGMLKLNNIAGEIINKLKNNIELSLIKSDIMSRFDVSEEQLSMDIDGLLYKLKELKLLEDC